MDVMGANIATLLGIILSILTVSFVVGVCLYVRWMKELEEK